MERVNYREITELILLPVGWVVPFHSFVPS